MRRDFMGNHCGCVEFYAEGLSIPHLLQPYSSECSHHILPSKIILLWTAILAVQLFVPKLEKIKCAQNVHGAIPDPKFLIR